MNMLFASHSGLRYLILLAGVAALIYFLIGQLSGKAAGRPVRLLGAAFVGLLDLQILLGLAMVAMGRFYPAVWGHLAMMLAAAVVAHVLLVIHRRRATPGHLLPLLAVAIALALIVGGILALPGRGVFTMTPVG